MRSFNKLLFVAGLSVLFVCSLSTATAQGQTPKIYIIDKLVANTIENIDGATSSDKIFHLPDAGNPLSIIATELKTNSCSEVHLLLLTKPGSLIFDELTILADNIDDYAYLFVEWKDYLSPGTKIIIHSDTLTSVPDGLILIERISELTGAFVTVQN